MTPAPAAEQAPTPSETRKASNGQTTTWIKHEIQPLEDTIYLRNDTQWPLVITSFQFYDCANIKPACTTSHPGFRIAPHQTRVYMQVQPADVQGLTPSPTGFPASSRFPVSSKAGWASASWCLDFQAGFRLDRQG